MLKKFVSLALLGILLFGACKKSDNPPAGPTEPDEPLMSAPTSRNCAAYEVLQEQLKADPTLQGKMNEIEAFTRRFAESQEKNILQTDGTMLLPVVVNVLYRTSSENISDAQIQSQITALNQDYAGTNSDIGSTPSLFQPVLAGNTKITFTLDQVIRKKTNKRSWSTNDAMKKSSQGGLNPTSPTTKLNIWVCTLSNGILGYAQFPGGNSATDGVVILNTAFGTVGTATAPFAKGRTATHEIGHWLNLRHIWGDATCGNDFVDDTPTANTANYGCPAYPHYSTCSGNPVEMTMNYMDYTDDACMYMFSAGQKTRMQATYALGGPRASFR